jgi:hypothetical protein
MGIDVVKVNARWKTGLMIAFAGGLWLFHLTTAMWFAAHSVPCEAVVTQREEQPLRIRRRFWAKLEVAYADANDRIITETVLWHITPPPAGQKIIIWRADSGLIKVGPASWAEAFFFETMVACIALFLAAMLGLAKICLPQKDRRGRLTRKP